MPGGQCLTQKSFPNSEAAKRIFWPSKGIREHASPEIFKIKGPILAKMHFPRFQLGKLDKNESARSLALKFGHLKNCGGGGNCPLAPH